MKIIKDKYPILLFLDFGIKKKLFQHTFNASSSSICLSAAGTERNRRFFITCFSGGLVLGATTLMETVAVAGSYIVVAVVASPPICSAAVKSTISVVSDAVADAQLLMPSAISARCWFCWSCALFNRRRSTEHEEEEDAATSCSKSSTCWLGLGSSSSANTFVGFGLDF